MIVFSLFPDNSSNVLHIFPGVLSQVPTHSGDCIPGNESLCKGVKYIEIKNFIGYNCKQADEIKSVIIPGYEICKSCLEKL